MVRQRGGRKFKKLRFNSKNLLLLNKDKFGVQSGDVVNVVSFVPRLLVKKGTFQAALQLDRKFTHGQRILVNVSGMVRRKKQKFLFKKFDRIWRRRGFLARIVYMQKLQYLKKKGIKLSCRIRKVLVRRLINLFSPTLLAMFEIKKQSKKFRRKNLYYLLAKYIQKRQRLAPVRRKHRRKTKNR